MYLYAFRDIVKGPPESPLVHLNVDISQVLGPRAVASHQSH